MEYSKHEVSIVRSGTHNPWHNLALENLLTDMLADETASGESRRTEAILYLWQNEHTVVIGRNQNAWSECLTGLLENEGGKLARRSTGGGAVYHDLGNLNFSLILPRSKYCIETNFQLILQAVHSLGIPAQRSGRNDLLVNDRKFSGNAFSQKKDVGLHHGTLLIDSDYGKIARYLNVTADKFKGKGVTSVRSRVINLREIKPEITVDQACQAMENTFIEYYALNCNIKQISDIAALDQSKLKRLEQKYASWEWRYGQTMKFDVSVSERFAWGKVTLGFNIEKGLVSQLTIYSDALDSDFLDQLSVVIPGTQFHSGSLAQAIMMVSSDDPGYGPGRQVMSRDIADLMRRQNW